MGLLGWAMFGAAARWWQLGIQMRPHFAKESLYPYPIYMAVAAGFGYYLQGAEEKQKELVQARKRSLLEKRGREDKRIAAEHGLNEPVVMGTAQPSPQSVVAA